MARRQRGNFQEKRRPSVFYEERGKNIRLSEATRVHCSADNSLIVCWFQVRVMKILVVLHYSRGVVFALLLDFYLNIPVADSMNP